MLEVLRPIPARQLCLLVFDLDGTLIDSRKDLATAVNVMLGVLDRPALAEDVIAGYIGDGAGMLVRRALGDPSDERLVARGLGLFLESYREHKLDHTYVYEGVFAALETLGNRADGAPYTLAVLTNKPINPSLEICTALGLAPYFSVISGGNSFATKKPDPEGLRAIMRGVNAKPEETLMIGDSEIDILTARAAGTWSLGCRYGLSPHSIEAMREQGLVDAVVDAPAEWPRALGRDSYAGAHHAGTGLIHGF